MNLELNKYFKLIGTDNDGIRHRYSIEKNEDFKKAFTRFMNDLSFDGEDIKKGLFMREDYDANRQYEIKVDDLSDICFYFRSGEYEIDLFFGGKKIILVIRTGQKIKRNRRKKLVKEVRDNSKWRKPVILTKAAGNTSALTIRRKA